MTQHQPLRVAAAQISPVFLDRAATVAKIQHWVERAAKAGVQLLAFPEACVPGYPTWLARTGGAQFDDADQKAWHARYVDQGVELPGPELDLFRELARTHALALVIGVMERGRAEGRGSLWCTALSVYPDGTWIAHRKLMPTYEERLAWAHGDGHGLRIGRVADWNVGALNCWENWMPAARLALYGAGEEVHVSIWPGSSGLTADISRFTAREGRVFVLAASGILHTRDLPRDVPKLDAIEASAPDGILHSGGSRIVAPDGRELASLDAAQEGLVQADLDYDLLLAERQNFDPTGHYQRPDVFQLHVDRRRAQAVRFDDGQRP